MSRRKEEAGDLLRGAVSVFVKVTKSYWEGLFRCHGFPDLPRTNNESEQYFGSARYHDERGASGRKGASPAMVVVRGSVRGIAAVATPPEGFFSGGEIRPADIASSSGGSPARLAGGA